MLKVLLCFNIVFTLISIYLQHKASQQSLFDKVLKLFLFSVLFHVCYALVCFQFFADRRYIDGAAPFSLIYGPFFYFAYQSGNDKPLSLKQVLLHLSPFLIAVFFYLIILLSSSFRLGYLRNYYSILYSFGALTKLSYACWGIFHKKTEQKEKLDEIQRTIVFGTLVLITFALFGSIVTYTKIIPQKFGSDGPKFFIYSILFTAIVIVFRYNLKRLVRKKNKESETSEEQISHRYTKSIIANRLLDEYEIRLFSFVEESKIYLDTELNLASLAQRLRIPRHHLSQLFTTRIRKSFYQYINEYRVRHACDLLKDQSNDLILEDIAFYSGFNSKVSFNRYFKRQLNCTPSEYRDRARALHIEKLNSSFNNL